VPYNATHLRVDPRHHLLDQIGALEARPEFLCDAEAMQRKRLLEPFSRLAAADALINVRSRTRRCSARLASAPPATDDADSKTNGNAARAKAAVTSIDKT